MPTNIHIFSCRALKKQANKQHLERLRELFVINFSNKSKKILLQKKVTINLKRK